MYKNYKNDGIQDGNILKKFSSSKVTVFNPVDSCNYPLLQSTVSLFLKYSCSHTCFNGWCLDFRRAFAATQWVCTTYLTYISISDVLLLQTSAYSHTFCMIWSLFQQATYSYLVLQRYCVSLKQALAVNPSFKGLELSCSNPFFERLSLCQYSFKFTKSFSVAARTIS